MKLAELQPQEVWSNFEKLCQIPHPSQNLKGICDYVEKIGKDLGLVTRRDIAGNILIRKPATKGYEHLKMVCLQAHLDMVPQKNAEMVFDFKKDAVKPRIDGEWVKATNTTLGADNGIGVATILSILQSTTIEHGPLEALFTTDEEIGMLGSFELKPDVLQSDILINLDSEQEGELIIGCAGGIVLNTKVRYQEEQPYDEDIAVKVTIKGLQGGHSGIDIHLQRANANKLMARFLRSAIVDCEARLSSVSGGDLHNAIPREATAVISIPSESFSDLQELCNTWTDVFRSEFAMDDSLVILLQKLDEPVPLMPEMVQDDVVNALVACPNGVIRYSNEIPSLVETSCNLSVVSSKKGEVSAQISIRSLRESMKENITNVVESIFSLAGAMIEYEGDYSAWTPAMNSPILDICKHIYTKQMGRSPEVKAIHAGLECGIIGSLYPNIDMISFGPTIKHPHSPNEKVEIKTVENFWNILKEVLKSIN